MLARRRSLVSEEEFLTLPETMEKVELIDGEVIVSPSPTFDHQEILGRVVLELRLWARGQPARVTVGQNPMDIRFAPGRILQPDAFVILDRVPRGRKGPIERVPDLCIEVISSDRVYDRVTKRAIYAEAGVREYWIVESTLVERRTGPGLETVEEITATLTTDLLPGFSLDVQALFAE